jgi:hypothetical protein
MVELAINPLERIDAMDFLKICRQDLDRLIEQSPPISDDVIKLFEAEFKETPNLKMPDICHGIEHTVIYDSSSSRLSKLAADAALHIRYKKNMLAQSIVPNIDKKIEEEMNTRIEQRIKELIASGTSSTDTPDVTHVVANLETDWRRLLVSRKQLLVPATPQPIETLPEVSPADVRINIVGADEPVPATPGAPITPARTTSIAGSRTASRAVSRAASRPASVANSVTRPVSVIEIAPAVQGGSLPRSNESVNSVNIR